jgi:hypothetical protein
MQTSKQILWGSNAPTWVALGAVGECGRREGGFRVRGDAAQACGEVDCGWHLIHHIRSCLLRQAPPGGRCGCLLNNRRPLGGGKRRRQADPPSLGGLWCRGLCHDVVDGGAPWDARGVQRQGDGALGQVDVARAGEEQRLDARFLSGGAARSQAGERQKQQTSLHDYFSKS